MIDFHCPYGTNTHDDMMKCPSGFPGCGCMDDVMEEDGPGWDEYKRVRKVGG